LALKYELTDYRYEWSYATSTTHHHNLLMPVLEIE